METQKTDNLDLALKTALGLLFCSVLLPSNFKAIAIAIFGVTVLVTSIRDGWVFKGRFFLLNAAVYLLIALTLLYSANTAYAFKKLSTMSSLAVFPLVFNMLSRKRIHHLHLAKEHLLFAYVLSVFLFNAVTFIWYWTTLYGWDNMMIHFSTLIKEDMGKYNIHPIYLSMHNAVALLFVLYLWVHMSYKKRRAILLGIALCLFAFLILYAKKGPLLGLVLVLSLFIIFQRKKELLRPYLLMVAGLVIAVLVIPKTRERFAELIDIKEVNQTEVTSTNIRYSVYKAGMKTVGDAPFFGYGIGDFNDALGMTYNQTGNAELMAGRYNAHNQYISLMLIGGLSLLVVFFITMGLNFVLAIRYDNQLLILLLLFYGIVMFTENILERESGVIYFALFVSFFSCFSNPHLENKK